MTWDQVRRYPRRVNELVAAGVGPAHAGGPDEMVSDARTRAGGARAGGAGETARPSRRERRQAKLKAELFRKAVDLFAERGYDSVTVDEIAAAADIAKGTFFNYFPSKEHVLVEYRQVLLDDAYAHADTLTGDSARDLMKRFHQYLARRVRSEGERYEMLFKEIVARPHVVALNRSQLGRYRSYFDRFIEIGKRSGEIPESCDTALLADTIRDLWTGVSVTWYLQTPGASLEHLVLEKIDLLFDLFQTRAAKKR